jgi:hypothetical protein
MKSQLLDEICGGFSIREINIWIFSKNRLSFASKMEKESDKNSSGSPFSTCLRVIILNSGKH